MTPQVDIVNSDVGDIDDDGNGSAMHGNENGDRANSSIFSQSPSSNIESMIEDPSVAAATTTTGTGTRTGTGTQQRWYHRPRIIYTSIFVWITVTGGRFLAEYLESELNMGPKTIGLLLAVQKFVGVLSSSFAGKFADTIEERNQRRQQQHSHRQKILHSQGSGRVAVLRWGVIFSTAVFCLHGCHRLVSSSSIVAGEGEFEIDFNTETSNPDSDLGKTTTATTNNTMDRIFDSLPWYILLRIMYAIGGSFVFPVMDAICIDFLKKEGRQEDYGKERLYGAVSWALAHLFIGPCVDYTQDFAIVLYPLSIVATVGVLISLHLYDSGRHCTTSITSSGLPQSVRRKANHLRMKRRMSDLPIDNNNNGDHGEARDSNGSKYTSDGLDKLDEQRQQTNNLGFISVFTMFGTSIYSVAFLIALVTLASGQAVVDGLVFLLFDYLGSTYTLMSFTVVLTVAFEIPLFQIAPNLLETFGSLGLLILASICYIVRVIGYTVIPAGKTPWVLILEPLHGVTYAASQTASVDFAANLISQPGSEALAQGALQFFSGGGSVLGVGIGGWIQEKWGPVIMYRGSALVVIIGTTILGSTLNIRTRIGRGVSAMLVRHHVIPQEDQYDETCMDSTISPSDVEMIDQVER